VKRFSRGSMAMRPGRIESWNSSACTGSSPPLG
jgi:hypothetical protein